MRFSNYHQKSPGCQGWRGKYEALGKGKLKRAWGGDKMSNSKLVTFGRSRDCGYPPRPPGGALDYHVCVDPGMTLVAVVDWWGLLNLLERSCRIDGDR